MKIAIFSTVDKDARDGALQLLTKYAGKSPEVYFPVTASTMTFATSIGNLCKQLGIPTTAYSTFVPVPFADKFVFVDDVLMSIVHELSKDDAVGIMFTNSDEDHFIIHAVEDLALEVWDITEGLTAIEHHSFAVLDSESLREAMLNSFEGFLDVLSAYVAATVMESISEAVTENLMDMLDRKDISPFTDEE